MEKSVNVWNKSILQQTIMRLKSYNPGLAISTCVLLDHIFTTYLYFAVLPGIGERMNGPMSYLMMVRNSGMEDCTIAARGASRLARLIR
jgi:hypothetical protein